MLAFHDVSREYTKGRRRVRALAGVSLALTPGQFAVLRGPSGSGKTTLLLIAGGMLRPTSGRVEFDGRDLYGLSPAARAALRAERVGYVFQLFNLVPYLSAVDNVLVGPGGRRATRDAGLALLDRLGLAQRADHLPGELSVGERQRVAVARAIVHEPDLILADEPVAGLDDDSAAIVIECLAEQHRRGATILLATHTRGEAFSPTTVYSLEAGVLRDEDAASIIQSTEAHA